jgi:hypothetical protein
MAKAKKRNRTLKTPRRSAARSADEPRLVERVQTGVRIEKRLLKVLKGLAEYLDMSLGDLLEGVVLHALEGKAPFTADTLEKVDKLRDLYGLTLTAEDSHRLYEQEEEAP